MSWQAVESRKRGSVRIPRLRRDYNDSFTQCAELQARPSERTKFRRDVNERVEGATFERDRGESNPEISNAEKTKGMY